MANITKGTKGYYDGSKTNERRVFTYTGPASYVTGGDSITAEELSLGSLVGILNLVISNGTNVLWGVYNATTKKILWYSATATEATNASSLAAYTGIFEAIGR